MNLENSRFFCTYEFEKLSIFVWTYEFLLLKTALFWSYEFSLEISRFFLQIMNLCEKIFLNMGTFSRKLKKSFFARSAGERSFLIYYHISRKYCHFSCGKEKEFPWVGGFSRGRFFWTYEIGNLSNFFG